MTVLFTLYVLAVLFEIVEVVWNIHFLATSVIVIVFSWIMILSILPTVALANNEIIKQMR
jgi:hypothetical protein